MKALMGVKAQAIRKDKDGSKALSEYLAKKSDGPRSEIRLSNGKTFYITTDKQPVAKAG